MMLLGELALRFLLESLALAALWGAMGAAAAVVSRPLLRPEERGLAGLRMPTLAGLAGAMAAGSLASRFGAPEPMILALGRRDVPVVWSLAGALAGGATAWLARRAAT